MAMFHVISDAVAITRKDGVYKQTKVYRYKKRLYIAAGGGFVGVTKSTLSGTPRGTTIPKLLVDELELPFNETYDKLGRLCLPDNYKE